MEQGLLVPGPTRVLNKRAIRGQVTSLCPLQKNALHQNLVWEIALSTRSVKKADGERAKFKAKNFVGSYSQKYGPSH